MHHCSPKAETGQSGHYLMIRLRPGAAGRLSSQTKRQRTPQCRPAGVSATTNRHWIAQRKIKEDSRLVAMVEGV
jgi:hypothetical protein